jgi:photosystem I subunit X
LPIQPLRLGATVNFVNNQGETELITNTLLAVVPHTLEWSPKVAVVMIVCNVLAIAFGKLTIKEQNVGLKLPSANLFGGMSHGAMLGVTSFGHVLGAGAILGLSSMGVL